jgi:uncharacterized protein YhbP (UPF0306 family)
VDGTVREFLDAQRTLTLAISDEDGPWAADVYYVRTGRDLCFFSSPKSRHARACATDPRAAGTIHAEAQGWRDIRGVQMAGRVEEIEKGAARGVAVDAYLGKFPFAKPLLVGDLLRKVRFYRFTPEKILWIDNSEGLGKREDRSG